MGTRTVTAIAAAFAMLATACGSSGESASTANSDTVEIAMVDIGFEPKELRVPKGEEVTFRFTNKGRIRHEGYVGTVGQQEDHAREMAEANTKPAGHGGHGGVDRDGSMVTVDAGKTGDLTYTFAKTGTLEIGCHEPGHYAAGMKITVVVT